MDGDGVDDVVNIHGGDSRYDPDEHKRSPAFLVGVSGRTGRSLMEPIPMPDGHESYSSPVEVSTKGRSFVVFGSGGETVPGSLWAVEVGSLRRRVRDHTHKLGEEAVARYNVSLITKDGCSLLHKDDLDLLDKPVFNSSRFSLFQTIPFTSTSDHAPFFSDHTSCPMWGVENHLMRPLWNAYDVCLYEVARGARKGVILPPVQVDVTGDGVRDLVVSLYEGVVRVLDGRDLVTVVWEVNYPTSESYR